MSSLTAHDSVTTKTAAAVRAEEKVQELHLHQNSGAESTADQKF